jgi:hypothetical protein
MIAFVQPVQLASDSAALSRCRSRCQKKSDNEIERCQVGSAFVAADKPWLPG